MGPGTYDADRADGVTRSKMPNINMGSPPAKGSFNKKDDAIIGPGQYNDGRTFGSETKPFINGEKRVVRIVKTMGPGEYSPERGDALTEQKIPNIIMGLSPSRGSFTKIDDANIGPGQYDDSKDFGKVIKSIKIGEKRQEKIVETMDPDQYSPERGDVLNKIKTVTINMGRSPARPTSFAKTDGPDAAPR